MLRPRNLSGRCVVMSEKPWSARLVGGVAAELRRLRTERKMSNQKLADACMEIGFDIPRAVLANLELRRRETITVPELLVIARGLDVPPSQRRPRGLVAAVVVAARVARVAVGRRGRLGGRANVGDGIPGDWQPARAHPAQTARLSSRR